MEDDVDNKQRMEPPITFDFEPDVRAALEKLAGGRKVRLSGQVRGDGRLHIDAASFAKEGEPFPDGAFVAVNAPFVTAIGAT
jgi:hypothetical protein